MPPDEYQYRLLRVEQDVQRLESRLDSYIRRDIFEATQQPLRDAIEDIHERMQRIFWALVVTVLGVAGNLVTFFLTRS